MGHVTAIIERSISIDALSSMQAATLIANDVADQTAIIRHHDRLIRHVASRFARRGIALEDLVQEGRIELLRAAKTFRADSGNKLWSYARKFVVGAMLRYLTREVEEPSRASIEDTIDDNASDGTSPESSATASEIRTTVSAAMTTLDAEERRILAMYFNEDKGLRSIAKELNVSLGSAHERFHSALVTLQSRVGARL